jgi:hypothetical protein
LSDILKRADASPNFDRFIRERNVGDNFAALAAGALQASNDMRGETIDANH